MREDIREPAEVKCLHEDMSEDMLGFRSGKQRSSYFWSYLVARWTCTGLGNSDLHNIPSALYVIFTVPDKLKASHKVSSGISKHSILFPDLLTTEIGRAHV